MSNAIPYRSNPEYVDTRGAAALCGIAPMTLHNYRFNKRGPAYQQDGRAIFYHVSDVEAWNATRPKRNRRPRN